MAFSKEGDPHLEKGVDDSLGSRGLTSKQRVGQASGSPTLCFFFCVHVKIPTLLRPTRRVINLAKPDSRYRDYYKKLLDILSIGIDALPVRSGMKLKGAYLLNQYISNMGFQGAERMTTDLDYDYQVDELAISNTVNHLSTVMVRKYPGQFLRVLKVRNMPGTHGVEFQIDLPGSTKPGVVKVDFSNHPIDVNHSTILEMLSDKFEVNGSSKLLRRSKDAYDLTIIGLMYSDSGGLRLQDFLKMHHHKGRNPHKPETLYDTVEGVEKLHHAMSRYQPNPLKTMPISSIISGNKEFMSVFKTPEYFTQDLIWRFGSWSRV